MKKFSILAILLCLATSVYSREPYHATVTVVPESASVSAPNLVDLSRDLRSDSIQALIPFYTPTTAVAIDINLRGIDVLSSFAANSTDLVITIPQAGITQTFSGGTRDASIQLFRNFIRDGGSRHRLLPAYARYSPIDPIAGNPNSLQAQMAQADYALGNLSPLSGCDCGWSAQPIFHQFQAGANICRGFSNGFDTTCVTLPLRYSFSPDLNTALILDAPFTYVRNGGASSLFTSLAIALRMPVMDHWTLTPILRLGAGGSLDLCVSGAFISAGLTSVYSLKISDYVVAMTNYAGYLSSTNLWLSGINFNYHLHTCVFKNGLSLTSCNAYTIWERPVNFSISFEDSYFARSHLYIKHFDEIGVSLITNYFNPYVHYDSLSLGFFYAFGEKDYKGYTLNLTYQF